MGHRKVFVFIGNSVNLTSVDSMHTACCKTRTGLYLSNTDWTGLDPKICKTRTGLNSKICKTRTGLDSNICKTRTGLNSKSVKHGLENL